MSATTPSNHTRWKPGTFVATGEEKVQPRKINLASGPLLMWLWVWTRGTLTVETVCAFSALAHNARIYWGEQGLPLPSASHPRPKPCAARQGEKWHARQAGH